LHRLSSARSIGFFPIRKQPKDDLVRIIDESGEDYLYHKDHFVFVDFPSGIKRKILALQCLA